MRRLNFYCVALMGLGFGLNGCGNKEAAPGETEPGESVDGSVHNAGQQPEVINDYGSYAGAAGASVIPGDDLLSYDGGSDGSGSGLDQAISIPGLRFELSGNDLVLDAEVDDSAQFSIVASFDRQPSGKRSEQSFGEAVCLLLSGPQAGAAFVKGNAADAQHCWAEKSDIPERLIKSRNNESVQLRLALSVIKETLKNYSFMGIISRVKTPSLPAPAAGQPQRPAAPAADPQPQAGAQEEVESGEADTQPEEVEAEEPVAGEADQQDEPTAPGPVAQEPAAEQPAAQEPAPQPAPQEGQQAADTAPSVPAPAVPVPAIPAPAEEFDDGNEISASFPEVVEEVIPADEEVALEDKFDGDLSSFVKEVEKAKAVVAQKSEIYKALKEKFNAIRVDVNNLVKQRKDFRNEVLKVQQAVVKKVCGADLKNGKKLAKERKDPLILEDAVGACDGEKSLLAEHKTTDAEYTAKIKSFNPALTSASGSTKAALQELKDAKASLKYAQGLYQDAKKKKKAATK